MSALQAVIQDLLKAEGTSRPQRRHSWHFCVRCRCQHVPKFVAERFGTTILDLPGPIQKLALGRSTRHHAKPDALGFPVQKKNGNQQMKQRTSLGPILWGLITALLLLFAQFAAHAQAIPGSRAVRPIDFIWGNGNSNSWKSFEDYRDWFNARSAKSFQDCMARPKTYGYGWSCGLSTVTGFDPNIPSAFYNGTAYFNWLRITDMTLQTAGEGVWPVQSYTSYRSRDVGPGTAAVYANIVCPVNMGATSKLLKTDSAGSWYDVVCTEWTQETGMPSCTINGVNNAGSPPLLYNPINPANSEKYQAEVDYSAEGGRLAIKREYRSTIRGWASPFSRLIDFTQSRPALHQAPIVTYMRSIDGGVTYLPLRYSLDRVDASVYEVHIVRPDGSRTIFQDSNTGFVPTTGKAKLTRATLPNGDAGWLLQSENNAFATYRAADGRLMRVVDANGYAISYDYPSDDRVNITSELSGRTIAVTMQDARAMFLASLPGGSVLRYEGGAEGLYFSVIYPDNSVRNYVYDETEYAVESNYKSYGKLTGIYDERGNRRVYRYDSSGQAISSELPGGVNRVSIVQLGNATTVTDPLGNQSTLHWYTAPDGSRRLDQASQPAGSGCAASTRAVGYDTDGNVSSVDDFNGNRTCYVVDATRRLATSSVEGLKAQLVGCGTVTPANSVLPAGTRRITTQWHPDWPMPSKRAEPARVTTWVYNGQPDPFNGGALATCAPATALLPDGKPIAVLCKEVQQGTTDASGSQGFGATLQSGVANRVRTWTYNGFGQVLTAKGPRTDLDDSVRFTYFTDTTADHTRGDLSTYTDALGRITQFTNYDAHGQLLRSVDPNGLVSEMTYDLRQRVKTAKVGTMTTSFDYDPAGNLTMLTLPDTTALTYTYDAASRLTGIADAAGNSVTYTLDNAGNREGEQVKDSSGNLARNIGRAYDALNRLQAITGARQ